MSGRAVDELFSRSFRIGSSLQLAFTPDGKRVGALGRNVVVWDVSSRRRAASAHPLSDPSGLCWTEDGAGLIVTNTRGETVVLDGQTLSVLSYLPVVSGSDPRGPVLATDGTFVEGSHDGTVRVRTLDGGVALSEHEPGVMITQIASDQARSTFAYLVALRSDDAEVQVRVRRWPFDDNPPHVILSIPGGLGWAVPWAQGFTSRR